LCGVDMILVAGRVWVGVVAGSLQVRYTSGVLKVPLSGEGKGL